MANRAAPHLRVRPKVRRSLVELTRRPTTPQRTVLRARVVLAAANGLSNAEIARRVKVARQNVIEIRRRFEERGLESVLADACRPGRPKLISTKTAEKIAETAMKAPPKNATHWSSRELAERYGVGRTSVQHILRSHNLQPHRVQSFKFSSDPLFAQKLRDIVGLYMNPPTNAIVLSVDEKSGVQALERTAPILPLRPGVPARQTHDYVRNGTTTLFAALNTLSGKVIEKCLPRHRHTEFLQFLEHIDARVPSRLDIHLILDNYATHKHPAVRAWFAARPRYHTHFTPTSSSWLNAVERFFAEITAKRIRRGTFRSVPELERAIAAFVAEHNLRAKPFVWTKNSRTILRKIKNCHAIYRSAH
ncbi:MAG TPA: IS630 family transposase [Candidatus Eremiobacteraceae bacterium]|nr:IS630 family transposase [Candidatus Eremiobacteraceae bacterium]